MTSGSQQSGGFDIVTRRHWVHDLFGARHVYSQYCGCLTAIFKRATFGSLCASGTGSIRAVFRAIAAWHSRRRERKKLLEYLASDHRAAADIGYPHRLP
jgi:hypothetical protein